MIKRFILIDKNQKKVDEIEMPEETVIKDIIRLDNSIFVLNRADNFIANQRKDFYFYERDSYDWLEEIELKRVKR